MARESKSEQIRLIDEKAKKDKKRWLLIMAAIMAAIVAVVVVICMVSLKSAPAALLGGVIGLAITAKLCMERVGKVNEWYKSELNRLENKGY